MPIKTPGALQAIEEAWTRTIRDNDVDAMQRTMADEWVLITADGNVVDRATFVSLVAGGVLVHDMMELTDWRVRVFDGTAIVPMLPLLEVQQVCGSNSDSGANWDKKSIRNVGSTIAASTSPQPIPDRLPVPLS